MEMCTSMDMSMDMSTFMLMDKPQTFVLKMEPDQASDSEQCGTPLQPPKRKKRNVRRVPDEKEHGPVVYEESCLWARRFLAALISAFPWAAQALREFFDAGVLLVTDYSGIGTAEMCLAMIREALIYLLGSDQVADFHVWRACDCELSCRRVLSSYAHHKPTHVMTNILDRLPCEALRELQEILADYRGRLAKAKEEAVDVDPVELLRRYGALLCVLHSNT